MSNRTSQRARDVVRSSYLGFPLTITDRQVIVTPPGGVPVACHSVSEARRFVRGYRKAERQEAMQ